MCLIFFFLLIFSFLHQPFVLADPTGWSRRAFFFSLVKRHFIAIKIGLTLEFKNLTTSSLLWAQQKRCASVCMLKTPNEADNWCYTELTVHNENMLEKTRTDSSLTHCTWMELWISRFVFFSISDSTSETLEMTKPPQPRQQKSVRLNDTSCWHHKMTETLRERVIKRDALKIKSIALSWQASRVKYCKGNFWCRKQNDWAVTR